MDEVRALLHYVQSVLVEGEFGQGHSGEMCKQQGACFDRVAKAERLLLVVDSQVWQAFHQLWDLCVVCGSFYNLRFIPSFSFYFTVLRFNCISKKSEQSIMKSFLYLTVMAAFKLKAGSEDHKDSPQHHVRGLVEEVVVQLGGVQQHLSNSH